MSDGILSSNPPNAAKLIASLRHSGYDNYTAIEDLIDNSIDADAKFIRIIAEHEDGVPRILIYDNGTGMDSRTLDEAFKLGSDTPKTSKQLGKF